MAQEQESAQADQQQEEEYAKPNPAINPRNIMAAEIAKKVAEQHAQDVVEDNNVSSIDDDGVVTPAPSAPAEPAEEPAQEPEALAAEPAAAPAAEPVEATGLDVIEPDSEYEVTVDGAPLKVTGQKLIDAGIRTFQKETAADYRLKQATELLREAEHRLSVAREQPAPQPQPQRVAGPTADDLAHAIQFGSKEQAAAAVAILAQRGQASQEEITRQTETRSRVAARDEMQFSKAVEFVQTEYADLLKNDHLKRLFFAEENRFRTPKQQGGLGDQRAYVEVYKDIGEQLRKAFNMPKQTASAQPSAQPSTPGTAAARVARKAAAPSVPRTASARLEAAEAKAKATTPTEIIAGMAATRGKNRLMEPSKRN